ncbi:MAG: hypothetical protein ACR2IE_16645 [Candidatus Sumerlaeaceae bacterium]
MSDHDFLAAFENTSLPLNQWHHREHLRVAYLYLCGNNWTAALQKMRYGVQQYNTAHAIAQSPAGGYHETLTYAWLRLVQFVLEQFGAEINSEAFLDKHSQLLEKRVLLFFTQGRSSCQRMRVTPLLSQIWLLSRFLVLVMPLFTFGNVKRYVQLFS